MVTSAKSSANFDVCKQVHPGLCFELESAREAAKFCDKRPHPREQTLAAKAKYGLASGLESARRLFGGGGSSTSGDTSPKGTKEYTHVIIMAGTNDLGTYEAPAILDNLKQLHSICHAAGVSPSPNVCCAAGIHGQPHAYTHGWPTPSIHHQPPHNRLYAAVYGRDLVYVRVCICVCECVCVRVWF